MRRHRLTFVIAATVAVLGSMLITAGRAGAVTTLTVTPQTDLAGGQIVEVSGTGLTPGASAGWCEGAVTVPLGFNSCDQSTIAGGSAAPDGSFGGPLRLRRFIYVPAIQSWIDCVANPQRCVVGAGDVNDLAPTVVTTALSFAPPPPPPTTRGTISVSPSSGLDPGQFVTVTGSGFRPGAVIDIVECVPGAGAPADPTSCEPSKHGATADSSGGFSAQIQIEGTITAPPGPPTDCYTGVAGQCRVVAAEAVDFPGTAVATPISFSSTPTAVPGVGSVLEGNSGTTDLAVPVTLTHASAVPVTVSWATEHVAGAPTDQADQADPASDYVPASGTVTFAPGATTQYAHLAVRGDTDIERDEYVVIRFHDATNGVMGGFWGLGFGVIDNDDLLPTVVPGVGSVLEGDSGMTDLAVAVTLSQASADPVTVSWDTEHVAGAPTDQADQADPATDYLPGSGTITFAPGVTTQFVHLAVRGDTSVERAEYVVIRFHDATNGVMGGFWGLGFGVIDNDD